MNSMSDPPQILFRLIHGGGPHLSPTPTFNQTGDLVARNPSEPISLQSVDDHLSWSLEPTPFLSFCNAAKARRWVNYLHHEGARDITLIAVNASSMTNIFDAYQIAQRLGYRNDNLDPDRQLRYHRGEYLMWVGYSADSYRLLTVTLDSQPTRGIAVAI
ncbi:MAG: hypothetical protein M1837_002017 [Sclerophora amabilis]|nr:MAG: hypothetical protein M1837_002017 [Sclerophora amabilis]